MSPPSWSLPLSLAAGPSGKRSPHSSSADDKPAADEGMREKTKCKEIFKKPPQRLETSGQAYTYFYGNCSSNSNVSR